MARKQSPEDRKKRLERGRCPIHGTTLTVTDQYGERHPQWGCVTVLAIECPRKGCGITAVGRVYYRPDAPAHDPLDDALFTYALDREWTYLLEGEGAQPPRAKILQFPKMEPQE